MSTHVCLVHSLLPRASLPVAGCSTERPPPPGPLSEWKYCKRCETWKPREVGVFSRNNRTPDGLQFYCCTCHNRMTAANKQRRAEERAAKNGISDGSKSPSTGNQTSFHSSHQRASPDSLSANSQQQQWCKLCPICADEKSYDAWWERQDKLAAAGQGDVLGCCKDCRCAGACFNHVRVQCLLQAVPQLCGVQPYECWWQKWFNSQLFTGLACLGGAIAGCR